MIYTGHHYKVTDDKITATGKKELWQCASRQEAINSALYTHRLHNGNAYASEQGVIHCPTCGQIAIVACQHKFTQAAAPLGIAIFGSEECVLCGIRR